MWKVSDIVRTVIHFVTSNILIIHAWSDLCDSQVHTKIWSKKTALLKKIEDDEIERHLQ